MKDRYLKFLCIGFSFQEKIRRLEPCNCCRLRVDSEPLFKNTLGIYERWCVDIVSLNYLVLISPNEFISETAHSEPFKREEAVLGPLLG